MAPGSLIPSPENMFLTRATSIQTTKIERVLISNMIVSEGYIYLSLAMNNHNT